MTLIKLFIKKTSSPCKRVIIRVIIQL